MSNLKHLIMLACFLVGGSFAFGQSLSISPSSGTYPPNSMQTFTIEITGAVIPCQAVWNISGTSSSNYADFTGEVIPETITVGSGGTGSVDLTFVTPPSGELIISVTATRTSCPTLNVVATLTPEDITGGTACPEAAFIEDFESVAEGTGFPASASSPTMIGQGMGYLQSVTLSGMNRYFEVVSENAGGTPNNKVEARELQGEVYWESNNIPLSPCCSRDISIDVFGNGNSTDDYVEVYYRVNGDSPVLIERNEDNFGSTTVQFSSCDLPIITGPSNLQIQIRIQNNNNNERHGFDNVQVSAGTQVEAPQVQNITCSGDATNSTVTFTTVTECTPEFNINGAGYMGDNPVILASNDSYDFSVRDAKFPDCGITTGTILIDASGDCDFVLPITLLDFYGRAEADAIALYWTTSTELNNDYMAVERSLNGIDFEEIGRVEGKGTTSEQQQYTFVDNYPIAGTNYYRLRQVDYDGTEEYHPVISVLFDKPLAFGMNISPNPVRETLQVDWSLPETQDGILRVFDMQGQLMSQRAIAQGSGRYNLPTRDLPAGLYILQMEQGRQTQTLRFVKE